jgi:hypothetical protein
MLEEFAEKRWTFHGRLVPAVPPLTMEIPEHTWSSNLGFDIEIGGPIYQSNLLISVRQLSSIDIRTLRNAVEFNIQTHVDMADFLGGAWHLVDLVSARSHDGDWHFFNSIRPGAKPLHAQIDHGSWAKIAGDQQAHNMLADYRESERVAAQTGFFCWRAVEAAMQSFREPGEPKSVAWDRMRGNLNISRAVMDRMRPHADWVRHGETGSIEGQVRAELTATTREIISRYLAFIERDRTPLSSARYPLLV